MNVISAMNPCCYEGFYTEVFMRVWFEEYEGWLPFTASMFDCERHGKELWIRAMAGEFGPIKVLPSEEFKKAQDQFKLSSLSGNQKLLTYQPTAAA
jgi:hypothetical protein